MWPYIGHRLWLNTFWFWVLISLYIAMRKRLFLLPVELLPFFLRSLFSHPAANHWNAGYLGVKQWQSLRRRSLASPLQKVLVLILFSPLISKLIIILQIYQWCRSHPASHSWVPGRRGGATLSATTTPWQWRCIAKCGNPSSRGLVYSSWRWIARSGNPSLRGIIHTCHWRTWTPRWDRFNKPGRHIYVGLLGLVYQKHAKGKPLHGWFCLSYDRWY